MFGVVVPVGTIELAAAFLAATRWQNTVTTGSVIVGTLVAIGSLIAVVWGVRYRVSFEAASGRAGQLSDWLSEALAREERLEARLVESQAKLEEALEVIAEQRGTLERLSKLENLEVVLGMMNRNAELADEKAKERLTMGLDSVRRYFDTELDEHETHAQERHDAQLEVLTSIKDTLVTLVERQAA